MIAYLRGTVADIGLDRAVIECSGLGYEVLCAPRTLATLRRGEEAKLMTTMVVREDSQTLYGFEHAAARSMFDLLQKVSGLGPRLALACLAMYSTEELSAAISAKNARALQKIPGVGKRLAERILVDLDGKTEAAVPADEHTTLQPALDTEGTASTVIEALVGLGFPEKTAEPAVAQAMADNPEATVSTLLHAALARLGGR